MPIQVKTPDGNIAQFPDGMSDEQISAVLAKEFPAPKASPPAPKSGMLSDVVKSGATGLAKGVAGLVGLPGDIQDAGAYLAYKAEHTFGDPTKADARFANYRERNPGFSDSETVNKAIQGVTGEYHQPQTVPGKYAETIASFAPAAAAPGGILARAGRVVAPAVGSETAGQITKGTAAEPYARVIGALAGGAAGGITEAAATAKRPTPGVPTTAELKQAAHQQYGAADNAGLIVSRDSMKGMAQDLQAKMAEEGLDATLHPKATAVVRNIAGTDGNVTLKGIDILRQQAGDAAGSLDPAERRLGRLIKDHIDDYVSNLQPSDVVQGDAQGAAEAIGKARDFWSRASKGEIIDNAIAKAQNSASLFSGSGVENSLRTQFRKLANNDRVMRRFSPDEQDAIRQVSNGTAVGNALRFLGKFSPHGALTTLATGGAGYELGGPVGAAAALAAGQAGRIGATAITTRNARMASELVRSGAPKSISGLSQGKFPQLENSARPALNDQSPLPYAAMISALAAQQSASN